MSSTVHSNTSLPDALVARARAATDGRLVLDVASGLFVAIAIAAWHPRMWLLPFSAAVCFAAYGGWGIADRELRERADIASVVLMRTLRAIRALAAAAGAIAAIIALCSTLGLVLGTWIS